MAEPIVLQEVMPAVWTVPVSVAAWEHAGEAYPKEAVGVVRGGSYERLDNTSSEPTAYARLAPAIVASLTPGDVLVHSHPEGLQCPSAADMRAQQQSGIPFIILPIGKDGPLGKAFSFPQTMSLLGRPFRHGVTDCYSLVRDFYKERGVVLDEFPRDWNWWHGPVPLDLYSSSYASQGFTEIDVGEATQEGDLLLCSLRSRVAQHAAIVLDDSRILHHPAGAREYDPARLSTMDLRSTWLRFCLRAIRRTGGANA